MKMSDKYLVGYTRTCHYCPREIQASSGAVLIRDLIKFMETGKQPDHVREMCGLCSMIINPEDIK